MTWLANIFGTSDYLVRDPYRKLVVGIAHAWFGAYLIKNGVEMWVVLVGYLGKEIIFDMACVFFSGVRSKLLHRIWVDRHLVADSAVDWVFTWLGAASVFYGDTMFDHAVLAVGASYFVAGKVYDKRA